MFSEAYTNTSNEVLIKIMETQTTGDLFLFSTINGEVQTKPGVS